MSPCKTDTTQTFKDTTWINFDFLSCKEVLQGSKSMGI